MAKDPEHYNLYEAFKKTDINFSPLSICKQDLSGIRSDLEQCFLLHDMANEISSRLRICSAYKTDEESLKKLSHSYHEVVKFVGLVGETNERL